jgi:hypothetical protein
MLFYINMLYINMLYINMIGLLLKVQGKAYKKHFFNSIQKCKALLAAQQSAWVQSKLGPLP